MQRNGVDHSQLDQPSLSAPSQYYHSLFISVFLSVASIIYYPNTPVINDLFQLEITLLRHSKFSSAFGESPSYRFCNRASR